MGQCAVSSSSPSPISRLSTSSVPPKSSRWRTGLANGGEYAVHVVASSADALTTGSGLKLLPHRSLTGVRGPIDTLVVAGGTGVVAAQSDERLIRWIRWAAPRARRVASVCNGAFLLAEAGLLDGCRATTHWAACDALRRRYPAVEVDRARSSSATARSTRRPASPPASTSPLRWWRTTSAPRSRAMPRAARPVPPPAGEPGPVQLGAVLAAGRAAAAARPAVLDRRQPHRRPLRARARRARVHEPAQLRAGVPARGRRDAGAMSVRAARPRPRGARGRRRVRRRRRCDVRLRNRRDDAARLPAPVRDNPRPTAAAFAPEEGHMMQIAIPLYDRFTALDAVGPYEVLSRLPDSKLTFVGYEVGPVRTDNERLAMYADAVFEDIPEPEVIVVPGGWGTRALLDDERILSWIRHAHEHSQWTTSVCTGLPLARRRGSARRPGRHLALARARRSRRVRRVANRPAGGRAGQGDHRGRCLVGNRHGPDARRQDRGRGVREDAPAPDRIRPRAPVRRGGAREGGAGAGREPPPARSGPASRGSEAPFLAGVGRVAPGPGSSAVGASADSVSFVPLPWTRIPSALRRQAPRSRRSAPPRPLARSSRAAQSPMPAPRARRGQAPRPQGDWARRRRASRHCRRRSRHYLLDPARRPRRGERYRRRSGSRRRGPLPHPGRPPDAAHAVHLLRFLRRERIRGFRLRARNGSSLCWIAVPPPAIVPAASTPAATFAKPPAAPTPPAAPAEPINSARPASEPTSSRSTGIGSSTAAAVSRS